MPTIYRDGAYRFFFKPFGFWIIVDDREYFVPFDDYPGFRAATVGDIFAMERIGPAQVHWPPLDIDVELDALDRPDAYPLQFGRQVSRRDAHPKAGAS